MTPRTIGWSGSPSATGLPELGQRVQARPPVLRCSGRPGVPGHVGVRPRARRAKGERIRISLGLPDKATLAKTKRVLLMLTTEKGFPPRPTATVEQDGLRGLPGRPTGTSDRCESISPSSRPAMTPRTIGWSGSPRATGFQDLDSEFKLDVRFYDAADARVYQATLEYDPVFYVLKGDASASRWACPTRTPSRRPSGCSLRNEACPPRPPVGVEPPGSAARSWRTTRIRLPSPGDRQHERFVREAEDIIVPASVLLITSKVLFFEQD